MKKIMELIVKLNEDELEEIGVDAVSLVENPAIELPFLAFATQEEFVEKQTGESEEDYLGRCIPKLMDEGYDQDQAAAICYSSYQDSMDASQIAQEQDYILSYVKENGVSYDPLNVTYVDVSKGTFSTIGEWMKGLAAIDLLTKPELKKKAGDEGTIMYRYAGPPAQRAFCKALQNSNKLFSRSDIDKMHGMNSDMGHNRQGYSKWLYAGSANCKHYWEEIAVFKGEDNQLIFVSHGPATQSPSDLPLNGYYSEKTKKRSEIAYAISQKMHGFSITDEEARVVVGPVLIPNKLIRRLDENNEEYFVYFSEQTVADIAEMMMARNLQNNTNAEHRSSTTHSSNTLIESWLVADPKHDKSTALGFDVPKGTLMQSRRINDEKMWQDVKDGKLRGFSVEGVFLERATSEKKVSEDAIMAQIMEILRNVQ